MLSDISTAVVRIQTELASLRERSTRDEQLREEQNVKTWLSTIEILDFLSDLLKSDDDRKLRAVERRMKALLSAQGVEAFSPVKVVVGEVKVLDTRALDDKADGDVLEVQRLGFRYKGKVIRPAEVISNRMKPLA